MATLTSPHPRDHFLPIPRVAHEMPAPLPVSVRVRDLAKRYRSVEALRGVSFDVEPGEIFGLLGPNGAGKTTALECILGLRRPDSGSVSIAGIDALARPEDAKQLLGAQIQAAALQDKITPRKALGLFASFYRQPADVGELMGRFGLGSKADAPFDSLSGGQRQRLFLALAFVNNPSLVVLDEPTAGLDPASRRELHDLIVEVRRSGRTVLISTHDLAEAQDLCDTVAILEAGRIVAADRPAALIAATAARSSVAVRTTRAMEVTPAEGLPGVTASRLEDGLWVLETVDAGRTAAALVKALEAGGHELLELQIVRPSLEDAYFSLTGKRWATPAGERK